MWKRPLVLLSRFKNRDSRCLREVVTGNETWLYFFDPDNKLNNKMWVGENNERPVVARRSRSVRRVMYALFFDSDGIVARVSVQENCSVTGTFYRDFVLSVVNHYQAKRPRAGVRGIKLLHDNAPAHRSAVVKSYLEEFHIQVLPHPPYSLTSLPVISGLTHISHLAFEDVTLRRALLWAVRCTSVLTVFLKNNSKMLFPNGFPI